MLRLAGLLLLLLCAPLKAQTIAFLSDLNGRYGSQSYDARIADAIDAIVAREPDLAICTGDMVAGQRRPALGRDAIDLMWGSFNRVVAEPFARAGIPFAVTPGNHDASAFPQFALEQQRFAAQWSGRQPALELLPGSNWPRRYGAWLGPVLLVAFDGTRPGQLPGDERDFLERMLRENGARAEVTIVFSHLPMWPLAKGREREVIDDPGLLELLHREGVDVYASGHHHVFFPGVDKAGMLHLAVGALGGNARQFSGGRGDQPHSFAVLEFESGALRVSSRAAPGFDEPVPSSGLPSAVMGSLGVLRRSDGVVPLRH